MRLSALFVEVLSLATSLASAAAIDKRQAATKVYTFSSPKSAEGIAARSNGQLLVSFFEKAEVWSLDPVTQKAAKIASFTDATCAAGITEIAPDVFAVVAGQGIWKIDLTSGTAKTTLIKKVPESEMWNGLTTLNNDTILIGDALKGAIFRMNVNTGDYSIAIQDPTLVKSSSGIPMGIDGLRYFNGTVYFTNISKNTLLKVPVDQTGKATGAITTIWSTTQADDLAIGPDGSAYVAAGSKIQKVTADGKISTVPGSVSSSTSCTLGRTDTDKNTLYVASSNGQISSIKV
ncbi:uncharacterized protein BDR25DRAFT_328912 [Lindgomyces ingoldianus]|uniref:Uncharacterized protein n=1 Tax=Lindgomyces ingoldianus TaxID=673940 RepID=A0ACB6QD83_9PLEO|nr:uncharacterized protein BDR25DRAFT_328912 [Lindgomyces ingoldianus]KAF2464820.1 hypothetical protein BDR25DRAFT_328912 [Lindgomyces ingoldianus]